MEAALKIALVSPYDFPYPGGVTQHVTHLQREFERMGHQVRIIAPSSDRQLEKHMDGVYRVGRVTRVPANGSIARITLSFRLSRRVRDILRNERFDVVHAHEPLMPALPPTMLRYSDALNVGTFHAHRGSYYGYFYGRPVLKRVFHNLDGRIAVSRAAKKFVQQYFQARYTIIPNGVDYPRFAHAEPLAELSDGRPNILFVGRPEKRKGLGYLIRAYPRIKNAFPDARVVVAGAGDWERDRYHSYAENHGLRDILFLGEQPAATLPSLYHSADVFCAPAIGGESFGVVLLEAMAAGVPIVASDIEGYRDVVSHGKQGLLVPPKDEVALADAVCQLLQDRGTRVEMATAGQAWALHFAWPQVAERILHFYGDRARLTEAEAPTWVNILNPNRSAVKPAATS
ncbi:MAG TPA: glycosyltransferase family 4 protein [Chloroflexota bacterium]|nr:glycosyltransferase family 4 protein [Chloroflexota bacterium]